MNKSILFNTTTTQTGKRVFRKRNLRPKAGLIPMQAVQKNTKPSTTFKRNTARFKGERVTVDAATKVLNYLNKVENVSTLAAHSTVGRKVGQRILEQRQRFLQFTSIDQLKGISGLGPVKFRDLVREATA